MAFRGPRTAHSAGTQRSSARVPAKGVISKPGSSSNSRGTPPSGKPLVLTAELPMEEEPLGNIDPEPGTFITRNRLKLRMRSELESEETGFLSVGTRLRVLNRRSLTDGTRRARVALVNDEMNPQGWVSLVAKDGSDSIKIEGQDAFSESDEEICFASSGDEDASRPVAAAAKSDQSLFGPPLEPQPQSSIDSRDYSGLKSSIAVNASAAGPSKCGNKNASVNVGAKSVKGPEEGHNDPSRPGKTPPPKDPAKVKTAEDFQQIADYYSKLMVIEREKLGSQHKSLKVRVGEALVRKQARIKDLVSNWARGGHGAINKMDFRKHVRSIIDENDVKAIDQLFDDFDADRGGSLDCAELTAAMRKLQQQAKNNELATQGIRDRLLFLQNRAGTVSKGMKKIREAEDIDRMLWERQNLTNLTARIGAVMLKNKISIGTVVANWEATDGEVDLMQFKRNILGMGLEEDDDELVDLFNQFDADHGKTLDLAELKEALEILKEASVASDKDIKKLEEATVVQWKEARAVLQELKKMRKKDEDDEYARAREERGKAAERTALQAAKEADEEEAQRRNLRRGGAKGASVSDSTGDSPTATVLPGSVAAPSAAVGRRSAISGTASENSTRNAASRSPVKPSVEVS